MQEKSFVISAYFNGSGHGLDDVNENGNPEWLANYFYGHTSNDSKNSKKFGFDGCGVQNIISGGLFGAGLDKQAAKVADEVIEKIKLGKKVTLNLYGHSRGVLAGLLLIKMLKHIDLDKLEINFVMMDPVPGSLLTTAMLDILGIYLPNKTMDLRDCPQLKNVLALYPHEPLPSYLCHAPQFCLYHENTQVTEEAIPGCHSLTQSMPLNFGGNICYFHTVDFLQKRGTKFSNRVESGIGLIGLYEMCLEDVNNTQNRVAHSLYGTEIKVKTNSDKKIKYFNLEHQKLVNAPFDPDQVLVTIEKTNSLLSIIKRCMADHPFLAAQLKWGVMAFIIAAGLVFSGSLGSVMAPVLALSLLAVIPVATLSIHALLYKTDLATQLVDKVAYPHFKVRNMPTLFGSNSSAEKVAIENNSNKYELN